MVVSWLHCEVEVIVGTVDTGVREKNMVPGVSELRPGCLWLVESACSF